MKNPVLFICILLYTFSLRAQTVDTLNIFSPSMNKPIKNVLILPAGYGKDKQQKYPVVYLLHGFGGRYDSFIKSTRPDLPLIASTYNMIIVCPDGGRSWYWDSPVNPESRYETYVSKELVGYIDSHYTTDTSFRKRAISGLSMGGHGALWLSFRHPDIFGAAGSMSGGVDIRPFPDSWEMKKQLGDYYQNRHVWDEYTVINQLPYHAPKGQLALIIDCGTEDFFFEVNQALHKKLLYYHIPHDYITRPGGHNNIYWGNSLGFQLLFFNNFFNSSTEK